MRQSAMKRASRISTTMPADPESTGIPAQWLSPDSIQPNVQIDRGTYQGEAGTKPDPSFYHLEGASLEFFKSSTGVADEEMLKSHILDIQAKAFEVSTKCPLPTGTHCLSQTSLS